jgi:N-methylhydantoinase B/oxoprolinase/acetone carboxylase alpha subunit
MKRIIAAAVVLASLTGGVYAQEAKDDDPIIMDQKQKKLDAEAIDKRYKSTLEKTRQSTTPARADPWSNMRGADDSKTKR